MDDCHRARTTISALVTLLVTYLLVSCSPDAAQPPTPNLLADFPNPSGLARSISSSGGVDQRNPFFQALGTNGRSCATCHQSSDGWTVTPAHVQHRFEVSGGTDPIFRPVDGANSPLADVSTLEAKRRAYSLLLEKGLIRVGLPIPAGAEFSLSAVEDPYGFASASELSLYRRPMPTTNLRFLSTLMWDGRESVTPRTMRENLLHQSNSAVKSHAEGARDLTPLEREQIVDLEMSLHTAQVFDFSAGDLTGVGGGPAALARQEFYLGINDSLGLNPKGIAFNPKAITVYDAWSGISSGERAAARAAVARGEQLFNSKPISISGVGGLNDVLKQPTIQGTCTTCHDSPNVGNHSLPAPLNIGLTDASRRTADLPLYTLKNTVTGETVQSTDPGRALVSGKWSDIGKFKGPILRGLAARAPYFHNGSAASLQDAVNFYNSRFAVKLSDGEINDLVAFLKTL
jgi:cytochrome c peroxidase